MGVFAGHGQARTFDLKAGDVGYVPMATGHYLENTGTTQFQFLETFKRTPTSSIFLSTRGWL